ncbi:hypothetical protein M514_19521 [Trichuris suis]|uniref:RNA-directed DNA polymerase n=1 Tax=Trichuris suis TaxID=68888 RepID=A0A085NFL3_9BILA|nr:hypothetical protein M514_19521 [Trichuris suis]
MDRGPILATLAKGVFTYTPTQIKMDKGQSQSGNRRRGGNCRTTNATWPLAAGSYNASHQMSRWPDSRGALPPVCCATLPVLFSDLGITNHAPLQWLAAQKMEGRLARCAVVLQEFDMVIAYRPGHSNGDENTTPCEAPTLGLGENPIRTARTTHKRTISKDAGHTVSEAWLPLTAAHMCLHANPTEKHHLTAANIADGLSPDDYTREPTGNADALSRSHIQDQTSATVGVWPEITNGKLANAQRQDTVIRRVIEELVSNDDGRQAVTEEWRKALLACFLHLRRQLHMHDGVLGRKQVNSLRETTSVPVIPSSLKVKVQEMSHNTPAAGHLGCLKTLENAKRYGYWINMARHIEEYI